MSLIDSPAHTALLDASLRIVKRQQSGQCRMQHPYSMFEQIALIQQTFRTMTTVPYGFQHNARIETIGLGREVYRLFEAVQICGEWQFDPKPKLTEAVVITAFDLVGTPNGVNTPIFPVGNVTPAARRLIMKDPFFQRTPEVPWAVYCTWTGEDERRKAIIQAENALLPYAQGVLSVPLPRGVEYHDGAWRTFDVN